MLSSRLVVAAAILAGLGTSLLLTNFRWFRRVSLANRLKPFAGDALRQTQSRREQSLVQVVLPVFSLHAERLAQHLGINEPLSLRLQRARSTSNAQAFRLREFGWASASLGVALLLAISVQPPFPLSILAIIGLPLLSFLVLEQNLNNAISERQKRLFNELPVVSEQLAMLLSAGYSIGGALSRLAERNSGTTGEDLRDVCDRIRLGLSTRRALQEWADVCGVAELDRIVAILTLSDESGDLARLISDEAANVRRESQRRLVETIERRGQQVWVPVTIATLVPGVIFLIIPFLQALQIFSAT